MRNLRRARYLLLLAALVSGHQRVASAGSVAVPWSGPDNDSGQGVIANFSINSSASTGPVTGFTGTTGDATYFWEGGSNSITLTFHLQGGGTQHITVTPTGSIGTYSLSGLFSPLAFTGNVTGLTLSETNACFSFSASCPDIGALTSGKDGAQLFDFTAAPEPASMALVASGLAGLAVVRRRRKAA